MMSLVFNMGNSMVAYSMVVLGLRTTKTCILFLHDDHTATVTLTRQLLQLVSSSQLVLTINNQQFGLRLKITWPHVLLSTLPLFSFFFFGF